MDTVLDQPKEFHVAVIVLNYNSTKDLKISVPQLAIQTGVNLSLIIVDNKSSDESLREAKDWVLGWQPKTIFGDESELDSWIENHIFKAQQGGNLFFLSNNTNLGYSAGNNSGIRLARRMEVDAILIANPDMRFDNITYISGLAEQLFLNEKNLVAASRILGSDGKDQNPLRESTYWEELLWPLNYLSKVIKPKPHVIPTLNNFSVPVPKVSGCCQLIRMSFLEDIGYLDEGVFLYCEEPILASQVREVKGNILYVPKLSALHAHVRSEKANSSKRMLVFIKSRIYYLTNFSSYSSSKVFFLRKSYFILYILHKLKSYISE